MRMLGQVQMQTYNDAQGLATLDKLVAETSTTNPDVQAIRGNALYRLERYPEAITALKQAIDTAGADANPQWQQLLMAAYFDSDQAGEAAAIAEAQLAKNPDDKKLQMNMASIYLQSGQRSEEHTSELQSLMRISYAVFCLQKKKKTIQQRHKRETTRNE